MSKTLTMKSFRGLNIFILAFATTGLLAQQPAGGGGTAPRNPANPTRIVDYVENPFPLRRGLFWIYEIRRAGRKVGNLEIRVVSERREKRGQYEYIDFFRLSYKDGYLGRRYRRMLARTPDIFIQNPRNGKYYPFMKYTLRSGWRFHDMLVVSVSRKPIKGQMRYAATLKHLKKDREEVYMEGVGLYSMREGDVTYKLVDLAW